VTLDLQVVKNNQTKLVTAVRKLKLHPAQLALRMKLLYPSVEIPTGRGLRRTPDEEGDQQIEGDMTLVIACAWTLFICPLTSTLHANHPSLTTQAHVRFSAFPIPVIAFCTSPLLSVVLHNPA